MKKKIFMDRILTRGEKRKQYVRKMFNDIANRYDLLNHLLSAGSDIYWRRKAILKLNIPEHALVLDLACGTGDFAFTAIKMKKAKVVGIDIALNMLTIGKQKAENQNRTNSISFVAGDGEKLPLKSDSFDAVIIAFGVRNMGNVNENLREMNRILKPGGELLILEFSTPKSRLLRRIFRIYFYKILPAIGRLISKDPEAYDYLPESVDYFHNRREFSRIIEDENFFKVRYWRLFNGIAVIYKGIKYSAL